MEENQFQILIQELLIHANDIIDKLEEIRCGIIDVETNIEKIDRENKKAGG